VPESRVRKTKKPVYTPPPSKSARRKVSPPWLAPTMLVCFVVGLAWIALYYITQANMVGLRTLGAWNLVCGFGLIVAGVILATNWR
jgi:Cell division protein CrgA